MSDSTERGPDWIIKAFAEHYNEDAARVIDNMVQASIDDKIEGGVLTERNFPISALGQAADAPDEGPFVLTLPETDMFVIPSSDVPTGRVHHVLHFMDGDLNLFSRVWIEDRNPVSS